MSRPHERLVALLLMGIGVAGYLGSREIGGFAFDPLGSRAVPVSLSLLLVAVSAMILVLPLVRSGATMAAEAIVAPAFAQALGLFALTTGYIYAVFELRLPLSLMTLCFVALGANCLPMHNRRRGAAIAVIGGALLGFGAEWLFTRFFFVDLPTLW